MVINHKFSFFLQRLQKNTKYQDLILLFLLIFFCFPLLFPFFRSGFFPFHDDQQVARLYELDSALKDNYFPVRWVKDLGFGYGYPLFNFYPPFIYYLAETFHLIGFSFINSIKIIFILSYILAIFFMYFFSKKFIGKKGALIATFLYLYLPYRAVDCYVRGALAELFALSLLPAALWLGGRLFYLKKIYIKDSIFASIILAFLMITHNLTMLIFAPFYLLWNGYLFYTTNKKFRYQRLKLFIFSLILSVGLSCFFWLPALTEKKYTMVDKILLTKLYDFRLHFISLVQLWNSPWGYGGSLPGLDDGLSFQIGKIHLVLAFFVIVKLFFIWHKKQKFQMNIFVWAVLLFLLSVFASLSPSRYLWQYIKPLQYIQFPWRFLGITGLFVCFIAGASVVILFKDQKKIIAFLLIAIILVFLFNIKFFQPQSYLYSVKDCDYISQAKINWETSLSSFEYLPKGSKLIEVNRGLQYLPDINQSSLPKNKLEFNANNIKLDLIVNKTNKMIFNYQADKNNQILVNTFSFPGWSVYLNNKKINYQDNNDLKLINLDLPYGNYQVKIKFEDTLVRKTANIITIFSIIMPAVLLLRKGYLYNEKKNN